MTPIQIAAFRAHALTRAYQRKLDAINEMAQDTDPTSAYVSFSAGKDSAVIAHAFHAAHPSIPILMVDPGCPTHWLDSERAQWVQYAEEHKWKLRLFPWDKWWQKHDGDERDYRASVHRSMFSDLDAYAADNALTCKIMGMRAQESHARRMLISTRGDAYQYADGGSALLPIARWSTEDVWAYIITNDLPWLSIYDAIGPHARNGLVGRSGERYGRIEYLRMHYPDVWRWARSAGVL